MIGVDVPLLDSPAKFITLGVVLILAAAIGAGGNVFGYTLPVIKTVPRQLVCAVIGAGLVWHGSQLDDFKVTKLHLAVAPSTFNGLCPKEVKFTGTIRTKGGAGTVDYSFGRPDGSEFGGGSLDFASDGGDSVHKTWRLTEGRVGRRGIHGRALLKVSAPDASASDPVQLDLACNIPPRNFTRYRTKAYDAVYPAGWRIVMDDVPQTTYRRSKFASPSGGYSILIDTTPNVRRIRQPRGGGPGYHYRSYRKITLPNGRRVFEWRFRQDQEERVDLLFTLAGDGYGVLGAGAEYTAFRPLARGVAASITPR